LHWSIAFAVHSTATSSYSYYQPQIQRRDRLQSWVVEALLRWRDPERGLVSRASFFPCWNRPGLILRVGQWVLGQAAGILAAGVNFDLPPRARAINVSNGGVESARACGPVLRLAGSATAAD